MFSLLLPLLPLPSFTTNNTILFNAAWPVPVVGQASRTILTGGTIFTDMTEQIQDSLISYEREIIAGFSVNSSIFVGGLSVYFIHSPAVVMNMVANTLLQLVSPSSNITVHNHPLAVRNEVRTATDNM